MNENSKDDQSEEGGLLYRAIKFIFVLLFSLLYRVRIYGRENIPEKGGFLVCANNIHRFDPGLIMIAMGRKHRVYFMAREELFKIPLFNFLIRKLSSIPVKRKKLDRQAVDEALFWVRKGKAVGIFPEGSRNKRSYLLKPFDNQSMIALKSKAPVLPVAIKGPYKIFRPLEIVIGEPVIFENEKEEKKYKREKVRKTNAVIMESIDCLLKS